jgi:hypothetical protein
LSQRWVMRLKASQGPSAVWPAHCVRGHAGRDDILKKEEEDNAETLRTLRFAERIRESVHPEEVGSS